MLVISVEQNASSLLAARCVVAALCAGAVPFWLRVLRALMQEKKSISPHVMKVYFAKFIPSKNRGELIVMNPQSGNRKLPTKAGKSVALTFLVAAFLTHPAHGQQTANNDSTGNATNSTGQKANANNQQVPQQVLQELDAMKKRIEQLENQLKQQQAAKQPDAVPYTAKGTSPEADATAVPAMSAVSGPTPPAVPEKKQKAEPFAFADFTWLNGNSRVKDVPFDTKFFTPEVQADVDYIADFNHPADDTIGGSSEVFRAYEFQLTQLGVGGDFHYDNVRARLMTQFGMYSETTPRNDASVARGQWDLDTAYRYISEAYGGYHINALHGINVDAGIFMSYIGLFSYYNADNWAYQPSYVSSNTPWFFNGLRVQIFPTEHLKMSLG